MTHPFWKGVIPLFLLIAVCLIVFFPLRAQDRPRPYPIDVIPASPTAHSFHQYGDVPVTLFNGLPNISIPLMEVGDRDLRLPISLSYHASGINPEQHPSWVGLGWNLQAGGVITRVENGAIDETVTTGPADSLAYSYYTNYQINDRADWDSFASLQRFITPSPIANPSPDEFRFSFMGYSGSFYLNHLGQWQVKSKQNIAIQVENDEPGSIDVFVRSANHEERQQITRTFQRFVLTTEDGTRYTFGGDTSTIEFTQRLTSSTDPNFGDIISKSWYLSEIESIDGRKITLEYETSFWQAEQSVSTQLYIRLGETVVEGSSDTLTTLIRQQSPKIASANLIYPVYLRKIITPNAEVHFLRSETTQLRYNFQDPSPNPLEFLPENNKDDGDKPSWYQLDSIQLIAKGENEVRQYVGFTYSEDENRRLTLLGLRVMGTQAAQGPYTFAYNSDRLPKYNALKQDHWGYYNGRNFFEENPLGTGEFYDQDDTTAYYNSRNPVVDSMKAEILTKITYPTGGTTCFVYEPHDYSQIATNFPFDLLPVSGPPPTAGGLRIDSIISTPGYNAPEVFKTYHYVNDFLNGGAESSGILSDSASYATELQDGDIYNWELSSVPVEPFLTTDGNHITYSEVTEELSDGSFTVYRYTNHDNLEYRDENANTTLVTRVSESQRWRYDPFTSRELERGNLLSKAMYRADSSVVMEEVYTYNSDPNRFDEFVRNIDVKDRTFFIGERNALNVVFNWRITAFKEYTYTPYMTSKTERLYDPEDDSQFVETVYTYQYDNPVHNQLTRTQMTDSEDSIRVTRYTYPPDLTSNLYNRDTLVARHVFTPAVVQVDSVGSRQSFQVERYMNRALANTELIVLDSTITYPSGEGIDPIRMFYQYDTIGNIVQVQKEDDLPAAFIWGYNGEFPIAEVLNATADQILYTGFEEETSSVSTDAFSGNQAHVGNYLVELPSPGTYQLIYWQDTGSGWILQSATISADTTINSGMNRIDDVRLYPVGALMRNLTYDRLYGQTSLTDACGIVRRFRYDGLGRLKLVRDHQDRIEQSYFYRYQQQ